MSNASNITDRVSNRLPFLETHSPRIAATHPGRLAYIPVDSRTAVSWRGAVITADVSVVIAHYNAAGSLARALDSVAQQTCQVREIIVVDDASSPDQKHGAEVAVAAHDRARLVALSRNQGPASARNAGWDVALGNWIAFLDCDEIWHPDKIAHQLRAATSSAHPPALIATRVAQLPPATRPEEFWSMPGDKVARIHRVPRWTLLLRNPFPTSSTLVRRDVGVRFTAGIRHCEDYDLWLRLAAEEDVLLKVELALTARFKFPFGHSGLSQDVTAMMKGEFNSFARALSNRDIGPVEWLVATSVMGVRFLRQAVLHLVRSWRGYPVP